MIISVIQGQVGSLCVGQWLPCVPVGVKQTQPQENLTNTCSYNTRGHYPHVYSVDVLSTYILAGGVHKLLPHLPPRKSSKSA